MQKMTSYDQGTRSKQELAEIKQNLIQGGWKGDIGPYKIKKSSRRKETGKQGPPETLNN